MFDSSGNENKMYPCISLCKPHPMCKLCVMSQCYTIGSLCCS